MLVAGHLLCCWLAVVLSLNRPLATGRPWVVPMQPTRRLPEARQRMADGPAPIIVTHRAEDSGLRSSSGSRFASSPPERLGQIDELTLPSSQANHKSIGHKSIRPAPSSTQANHQPALKASLKVERIGGSRSIRGVAVKSSRRKRQAGGKRGNPIDVRFDVGDDLIQLLAELYARTQILGSTYQRRLAAGQLANGVAGGLVDSVTMGDQQSQLLVWLRSRQADFSSLRNATVELLTEPPKRRINICQDGPKILVLPNVSDVLFCYPHDQWIEKLWSDIRLSSFHYPIVGLSLLIFLFGTLGNIFVCLSVYRNHQLRNVTNYFIVNLAFADFLVILICLPATAIWDLTLTWFFGTIGCKLIMFLQDVSISVSVLTLTAISLDRYYAICHPLRFKSSLNQAKKIIALIWLVSLCIMAPDLVYLRAKESEELREAGLETILYSDCDYEWGRRSSSIFQFVKTIILYLVPLLLMLVAHYTILQTLHKASAVCHEQLKSLELRTLTKCPTADCPPIPEEPEDTMAGNTSSSMGRLQLTMHNKRQIESRRKAAAMLSAIVVLFGICYLPVHFINFLRQFIDDLPQNDLTSSLSMLSHCICYLNSAINPIIYNYMNSVFRGEFMKFLSCLSWRPKSRESHPRAIVSLGAITPISGSTSRQTVCSRISMGQPAGGAHRQAASIKGLHGDPKEVGKTLVEVDT